MKLVCALISGLLVLALAGGCGGESDTLTKAEFIEQADAICAKSEKKREAAVLVALKKKEGGLSSNAAIEKLMVVAVLPAAQEMTQELSALEAPDAKAKAIVAAFAATTEGTDEDPRLFVRDDTNPMTKPRHMADAYGMDDCVGFPTSW